MIVHPQINFIFVMEFAAATISKYLQCARNINPNCNLRSEVIIAVRFAHTIYERRSARASIMHLSPETTVGTSRPFNLAIIQRLLLVRLVHYSIAGNVARCVSSGGIRFIVPRDMHSYAFVAQRVRDTRVCLHFETTDITTSNGTATAYILLLD